MLTVTVQLYTGRNVSNKSLHDALESTVLLSSKAFIGKIVLRLLTAVTNTSMRERLAPWQSVTDCSSSVSPVGKLAQTG